MNSRFLVLDGLRGVAAVSVLVYHLFEAIAFAAGDAEQNMYHSFLAVDFFFILSGFVMGFAYDNRLADGRMSTKGFIRRRLIRLHPMVLIGVVFGLVCYCIQGCTLWDGTAVPAGTVLAAFFMALFILPVPSALDVRGNAEAFPLNGPHWSLFFEYLGSLAYVLLLRRMSTKWMGRWVALMAAALFAYAASNPMGVANGWSSDPYNCLGGLLRISFAYPLGLWLARRHALRRPTPTRLPAFTLCSLLLIAIFCMPSLSTLTGIPVMNAVYQCAIIAFVFPCVVWLGACKVETGARSLIVEELGRISYPLYAIHYPLIYLYIHWINTDTHPFGNSPWSTPIALFVLSLAIAWLVTRYYDEPVRRWLGSKIRH